MRSESKRLKFDELYLLRLDASARRCGARFAKLKDDFASAAADMKCSALILHPIAICRVASFRWGDYRTGSW
jgi:hypothetical protein